MSTVLVPRFPANLDLSPRLRYLTSGNGPCLNIGAGINPIEGAVNADLNPGPGIDVAFNVMERWPFEDTHFVRVFAFHILEHLPVTSILQVFLEAWRVLKPGGVFLVEVPDVVAVAQTLAEGQFGALKNLYACDRMLGDAHRWGYDKSALAVLAAATGYGAFYTGPGTDYHKDQMPTIRLEAVRHD